MWGRRAELVDQINRPTSTVTTSRISFCPKHIRATTDPEEAVDGVDIVVLAVPSQMLRVNLTRWGRRSCRRHAAVVSLMKGVELGTTMRMSEVIAEVAGVGPERIVVVSGPNLAQEIAAKQPAASVVACVDEPMAERVASACAAPYFRPYTNTDVVGTELGGAVKNVIALAVGMAEGMGMGDNTKSTIITRGLAETVRLGVALGADPATFAGSCRSRRPDRHLHVAAVAQPHVRREPRPRHDASRRWWPMTRQTAEGVKSCQSDPGAGAPHGVDVPIIENVAAVVHEGRTPDRVADTLMSRARKAETN